jgi:AcrR family transcriptional regulator
MPRKRTISNEALLDAALRIVRESGPDALSFATLASQVGLAPSTIVQRFGTKAELLRAALSRAWDALDEQTAAAAQSAPPGTDGVVELLVRLTGQYDAHDFADQLRVLREDLRDPVLRARGQAWLATLTAAVEERLSPSPGGESGLGALVVAHWQGTLTIWSFVRDAHVTTTVRSALEDLLARLSLQPTTARRSAAESVEDRGADIVQGVAERERWGVGGDPAQDRADVGVEQQGAG